MFVSINKLLIYFQNCFGFLSRLCRWQGYNTVTHFKCLGGQHNSVPRGTEVQLASSMAPCSYSPHIPSSSYLFQFWQLYAGAHFQFDFGK